jgi:hypothetical protein
MPFRPEVGGLIRTMSEQLAGSLSSAVSETMIASRKAELETDTKKK